MTGARKPNLLDRATAAARYLTTRQLYVNVLRYEWYSPPLAAILAVGGIFTFVMSESRPFDSSLTDEISSHAGTKTALLRQYEIGTQHAYRNSDWMDLTRNSPLRAVGQTPGFSVS